MQFHISREDGRPRPVSALGLALAVCEGCILFLVVDSIGAPLVAIVLPLMEIVDSDGRVVCHRAIVVCVDGLVLAIAKIAGLLIMARGRTSRMMMMVRRSW